MTVLRHNNKLFESSYNLGIYSTFSATQIYKTCFNPAKAKITISYAQE